MNQTKKTANQIWYAETKIIQKVVDLESMLIVVWLEEQNGATIWYTGTNIINVGFVTNYN